MNVIDCKTCGKKVISHNSQIRKYCSKTCYGKQIMGDNNQAKKKVNRDKISYSKLGKKNSMFGKLGQDSPNWKGDNASYNAKHSWIRRIFGNPKMCEECGLDNLVGRQINWANKSGKYLRNISDWKRLCIRCHRLFDKHWLKIKRDRKTGRFSKVDKM